MKPVRNALQQEKMLDRMAKAKEHERAQEEIRLAHDYMQAFPEMSYGEALKHAYAKLNKERAQC